jgi:tetratricopeptide (TPR) repeat protein
MMPPHEPGGEMFRRGIPHLLLLLFLPSFSSAAAQSGADDAYKAERKQAVALFNEQKHLEALPLFEDLAVKNPNDVDVLVGLGACLIDHSATLTDEDAAKKERVRAREYLLHAKQLGSTNGLLLNLLDLLPADGSIRHQDNAEVDKAIQAGEAAFAKRDYDDAIKNYSRAFELDPHNYAAALFIADGHFSKRDFPKAQEWYERAIQVNPDTETAYRYEADMLTKNGEMEKARTRAIQAVVAEPYNAITWRGLAQWANANHVQLKSIHINTHTVMSQNADDGPQINIDPKTSPEAIAIWILYSGTRVRWRKEEFKKHFPQETQYRHSLAEEGDALSITAQFQLKPGVSLDSIDPDLSLLKRLYDAKMIEPYVLLNAADQGIAQDYAAYRAQNRPRLEEYLSQFVVPPTSAKP